MTDGSTLANILRDARLARGWSVSELSFKADISMPSIRNFENARGKPSVESWTALVDVLDIEGEWVNPTTWRYGLYPEIEFVLRAFPVDKSRLGRARSHDYDAIHKALIDLRISIDDICKTRDVAHSSLHTIARTLGVDMRERARLRSEMRRLDEVRTEYTHALAQLGRDAKKFREQNTSSSEPTTE